MKGEQHYRVTLSGVTGLIMHADNVAFDDTLKDWLKEPANKKTSIAGDDRTPAWRWLGYVYAENGVVSLPSDNLMTMLREGGAKVPVGKGNKTFKAQTQSGVIVNEIAWPLIVGGKTVPMDKLTALMESNEFAEHDATAKKLGFELFVKRAAVGQSKHIRVRPRFTDWSASGTITVVDPQLTKPILQTILDHAGAYCGLCDWRPSSKTPGPWGRFVAELESL